MEKYTLDFAEDTCGKTLISICGYAGNDKAKIDSYLTKIFGTGVQLDVLCHIGAPDNEIMSAEKNHNAAISNYKRYCKRHGLRDMPIV